jgi:hypothetical protein
MYSFGAGCFPGDPSASEAWLDSGQMEKVWLCTLWAGHSLWDAGACGGGRLVVLWRDLGITVMLGPVSAEGNAEVGSTFFL